MTSPSSGTQLKLTFWEGKCCEGAAARPSFPNLMETLAFRALPMLGPPRGDRGTIRSGCHETLACLDFGLIGLTILLCSLRLKLCFCVTVSKLLGWSKFSRWILFPISITIYQRRPRKFLESYNLGDVGKVLDSKRKSLKGRPSLGISWDFKRCVHS